ncbi:MAG: preprotein translocase subunit SecY [Alphaproteobacteria bacterium]|nr:preprotein translocase subunit SecY [Alphaproteobacteria bacterium]OJV45062.1 MAG: preprotein translocase subunit SecY [Alphaproteobacteria bacterium 43-37]
MSSAAEQLASSINLSAFSKAEDLKKRLWFTLGALIVFRLGTYIPLPGIDPSIMQEIARSNSGGILGMFDMFSGGALSRMTIFALNIMPYISASIIMQLLSSIVPSLEAIKKEGELGRKKINQYTRYGTVLLATAQAYAIAVGLPMMIGAGGHSAVLTPGFFFIITTIVTLVGGTLFLLWLGEQITSRGIGNGVSLIIFAGIVANLPFALVSTLELGRSGAISVVMILFLMILVVAVIGFIVFMERAHRRVPVQYPKRQISGGRLVSGDVSHMPLKLNASGVIPPIFASSLLLLPVTISSFLSPQRVLDTSGTFWGTIKNFFSTLPDHMSHGKPLFIFFYVALIIFFCFFYTAIVFNPEETAENLRKNGGFVPGIRPGKSTSEYFDFVLTRLTVIGAAYISFICILPEIMMSQMSVPFYFGGTSLLIVVSVTMDTVAQVHSHLIAHQYEGLIKKGQLRGRTR